MPGHSVNYTVTQGLPQNSIYDIIQDKRNFLWIGTAGGLCRFDGYQFHTYAMSEKNPKAISSYKEFRFHIDKEDRLWIVSFNGISLYNELTDDFNNLLTYKPQGVVMAENHFFGEDQQFIWIGLCSYGIVKVDKQTLRVHHTSLTRSTHRSSNDVSYHGFLDNNRLWVIDNNESARPVFYIYDIARQQADTIPLPVTNIVNMNDSMALGMDSKNVFLINKKTLLYSKMPVMADGAHHNSISLFRRTANSAVLCSQKNGVFYINTQPFSVARRITHTDREGKKVLSARSFFEDRSGNTWIGMTGEGLEKIPYPYKTFRNFRSATTRNNVFGIAADAASVYTGMWWAEGLNIFSRNGKPDQNITVNKAAPQASNSVITITPVAENRLMLLAPAARKNDAHVPLIYQKTNGTIRPVNKEVTDFLQAHWGSGNLRNFLYKEAKGNLVLNAGEYLVRLTPSGETHFTPAVIRHFPGETIASGFTHSNGERWVGTFTGVFKEYDGGKWKRVALPEDKEIKSMCEDGDGNMWLGTNHDIYVVSRELKTIAHYTEGKELVNGHIYAIIRDRFNNIWFSHNKGLSVYRPKEKTFEHYNEQDGLQSNEFNVSASFAAEDGTLFFGGTNGVTGFRPEQVAQNRNTPTVNITSIKVFDEPLQTDTAYWLVPEIRLPFNRNTISFEFALPEFTRETGNRYQFMLSGVDDHWINAADRRFARYAGLQPGRYIFRVKGANSDGIWGSERNISITIIPPFWQRTWFRLLIIASVLLTAIGTGIAVQKWRQRKTFRKLELQHKIQLERERISRDLHDNVGTQLSLISKHLEEAVDPREAVSESDRMYNLRNISQTSKEVIFTLRETIWALNRDKISLEEMFDKLKVFAQKLNNAAAGCQLTFHEGENTDSLILGPSEAIHLFRISQEAIANSLKYANATKLDLECYNDKGHYRLIVADNGIGFIHAARRADGHYGLDNMQHRCDEIGCTLTIDTRPGKGTVITIRKK
ncbi:sensor histidine kinase [Sediminibacterium ginsengisoli]|uniref:sensor histidine kinase n=1 Tax=Sediminibacterium ginsengisoli TaxID=413434 RepID=UPI0015904CEA|nr:sensor histidine kinase [Sediminibacterium ginsengisoli]